MQSPCPSMDEMDELVAFLPKLYAEGFDPVKRMSTLTKGEDGVLSLSPPEYDPVVQQLMQVASREWGQPALVGIRVSRVPAPARWIGHAQNSFSCRG